MGLTEQRLVMDLLAWAGNVSSSVLIIFVNKVLMNTTGYGFQYGELLALHLYIARCSAPPFLQFLVVPILLS